MALWLMCACVCGVNWPLRPWGKYVVAASNERVVGQEEEDKLVRSQTCTGSRIPRTTHSATPVRMHAAGARARASTFPTCLFPLPVYSRTPDLLPTHGYTPIPPPHGLARLSSNTRQPVATAADKNCARVRRQSTARTAAS